MKTKEIRDLIEFISKTGLQEVNIETEELKISIKRAAESTVQVVEKAAGNAPSSVSNPVSQPETRDAGQPADSSTSQPASEKHQTIKSPMIGTFYRSSKPDSEPFIKVGDKVSKGQVVCIVEAMKLFNEIESDVSGTIVEVLVENASPVEYDQPLFLIDPA